MLAVTNGVDMEDHIRIQKSIGNRYPVTVSMGVGAAVTPYDAQRKATNALQNYGGAQSEDRKEVLAIDSMAKRDESFVQIAHIDINGITDSLTDIIPAYDTSFIVNRVQHFLMKKLIERGSLLFFIGGDNFMSPCNGLEPQGLLKIIEEIKAEINIALKAGVGKAPTAEKAANLADLALEEIRGGFTYDLVHVMKE
jgi:GTP cyclohydrolase IIa